MNKNDDLIKEYQKAVDLENESDYQAAAKILTCLSDKDFPPAIGELGFLYQTGLGVERDGEKAVDYLKKAVSFGFGPAAHNLGTIYGAGMPGVEPDDELSKYYRNLAIELGSDFIKK